MNILFTNFIGRCLALDSSIYVCVRKMLLIERNKLRDSMQQEKLNKKINCTIC